jgi:hypothetical protein
LFDYIHSLYCRLILIMYKYLYYSNGMIQDVIVLTSVNSEEFPQYPNIEMDYEIDQIFL